MVLFKRKPITLVPPPLLPADATPSTPVWAIPETGEWFLNYEDYLNRMSFYNVKKFVCETSGNSNFTFFEALKVEHNELLSMQANFPEPVKEPILRQVSFSTVPRIDVLVDQVYTKFKDEYFPGDKVIVKYSNGYRTHGIIKEKVVLNSTMDSNGVVRSPFIAYRIYLPDDGSEIHIEDASMIYRERNRFTKSYVKTFLKISLVRSNRLGAPWVIRDEIAQKYKISLEWPSNLKKFNYINSKYTKKKKISILNDENNDDDYDKDDVDMNDVGIDENDTDTEIDNDSIVDENQHLSDDKTNVSGSANQLVDSGMKSTRGFSHTIFENLKETPPTNEDMNLKWCENWYKILKRTTAFFEDMTSEDRSRDKVLKLFQFCGINITDKFDPNNTHFIITQRPFFSKNEYPEDDPFHYVHIKRIKVWHYEKCQRFFKSIKVSNRKIYQLEKQQAIDENPDIVNDENSNVKKGRGRGKGKPKAEDIDDIGSENDDEFNVVNASSDGFVNIAPAPQNNTNSEADAKSTKGRGKGRGKGKKTVDTVNLEVKKSRKNKISELLNNNDNEAETEGGKHELKTEEGNTKEAAGKEGSTESKPSEKKSHKIVVLEDLLLTPKTNVQRPHWKQLSGFEKLPFGADEKVSLSNVLEVWMFINMFHEALTIDTFTFDDFINAIQWKDSKQHCPLLLEIFCSMLSCIMSTKGEMLITLPVDIEKEIKMKDRAIKRKALLKEKEKKKQEEKEKKKLEAKNAIDIKDEDEGAEDDDEEAEEEEDEEDAEEDVDEEEDTDDEEEEEINHNAYSILDYKKTSWRERLQNRDFKNGSWLITLLGVFSISEYIKEFKSDIVKVYELLSPLEDDSPTPEKLMINFYENVGVTERISILSILMNLLLNGNTIRQHIDHVVEKSASLRRERFEVQKEIKTKIENAHAANKEVLEFQRNNDIKDIKQRVEEMELSLLRTDEEREKYYEIKNKGGRPIQNFLPTEPSSLEKAIAAGNPEFLKLLNIRSEKVKEVDDLKRQKIEIDKTLVELNSQRIRYLGRDRFWNRYWWFERNGLPNLGGNKGDEEDEEEGDAGNEDNAGNTIGREDGSDGNGGNAIDDDLDDEESDGEYDSETYLMGRIWIQGPSALDQRHLLENEEYGLRRKEVEEGELALKKENDWVYIDEVKSFEDLITWLEDKGIRERALKKELKDCKNRIINSFKARLKFIGGNERKRSLIDYIKKLKNNEFREEKEEVAKIHDFSEPENDQNVSKEENKDDNDTNDGESEERDDEYKMVEEDDEEESIRETRSNRRATRLLDSEDSYSNTRSRKRQRTSRSDSIDVNPYYTDEMDTDIQMTDVEGYIDIDNQDSEEVIRMVNERELPTSKASAELREQLINRAQNVLHYLEKQDLVRNMVLWVNSSAIEKQGYTHYEGPKIVTVKSGRGRKPRSRGATRGRGGRGRRK